jgi:hypothetical protein
MGITITIFCGILKDVWSILIPSLHPTISAMERVIELHVCNSLAFATVEALNNSFIYELPISKIQSWVQFSCVTFSETCNITFFIKLFNEWGPILSVFFLGAGDPIFTEKCKVTENQLSFEDIKIYI